MTTTAVSDETGREPFQSPQHIIEGIILRRLHDKRIEGYTLEMSKEIEAALSASPVGDDVPALKERIRLLEWAIAAKDKQILQFSDALSASPVAQEPVAWLPIDTRPLKTGRYLVGHRGWQEVMHYFGPEKEWVPGTNLGFHRLEKRGWTWCDPRVAFGATHCMPINVPSEDDTSPPATPAGVGADEIKRAMANSIGLDLDEEERMAARGHSPSQNYLNEWSRYANAILALLSRGSGSDQSNSTQKDG